MKNIIQDCFNIGQEIINKIDNGGEIVKEGSGFGDLVNPTETKAEKIIGEKIEEYLQENENVKWISIKSHKEINTLDRDGLWVCVDCLDGGLNYRTKGKTLGLPYSMCVTILNKDPDNAIFKNIVAAGVMDYRSGDEWISVKENDKYFATLNDEKIVTKKELDLDILNGIVIGEMYYPYNRDKLSKIFINERGWLRNPGSAGYEMALVSSGQALAFVCDRQKQNEGGVGYALVKGAGGVVTDFEGNFIDNIKFEFHQQTPMILGQNQKIVDELLKRIKHF